MNTLEIGEIIRSRRRTLRLDQRALAEIAGISVHSLSDIESGKGNPTVTALNHLATALGLELDLHVRRSSGETSGPS